MKATLNDLLNAKGVSEPLREAVKALINRLDAAESARRDDYQNWMTALDRNAELLAKLEAAKEDRSNFLVEMGKLCAKCDALCLRIEAAEKERDELLAKIERMEKQEPVGEIQRANSTGNYINSVVWMPMAVGSKLYALPGAQPAPSVPDGWLQHAARMAALARKLREPDWHFESIREMQRELCALEEAALAAAPEAKP